MSDAPTPRDTPTTPLSDAEQSTGRSRIGRYQILRVLGRGGMGIVVEAHDPELDRNVAIKILLEGGKQADALGDALRREAQALAKVHHPNVLSVYDAGVDGSPYLVMQLVEGETLAAHLERVKPDAPSIIALFLQAARGLAAIHAAGLIHRDFKPANALVDGAGVVWVSDLGLARIGELAHTTDAPAAMTREPTETTITSTFAGTPAYMAPEQFDRRPLKPACDQFSFCVALWEAILGSRPFRGADLDELAKNVRAGAPSEVALGGFTRRQLQALQRGLSVDPAARWPSMTALIAALGRPSRLPYLAGGGVLAAGATVAALALAGHGNTRAPIDASVPPPSTRLELSDARRLTLTEACDEYPSIGPDGTIYYDMIVGADQHLMAIDPATKQARELTTTKGWDLAPSPSPDGKRLAFLRKTDEPMAAEVADLADLEHPRRLLPGGFRPSWSPDGAFVWAGNRKALTRFDATTGAPNRTLELPKGAFPMAALELPDHRVIVLTKTGTATADGLAIYDPTATTARWLLPAADTNAMDEVLTRAPTGDAVLVARYTVTGNIEIWNVPLDGTPATAASGAAINARKHLAIAGRRIVWSDCTEYGTIAAITVAVGATKFVDLARNKWLDFAPTAIPGTTDLLFLSYRSTKDELWRMTRTGEQARHIPFGELELDRIAISPDGTWLAGANDDGLFAGPLDASKPPIKLVPPVEATEHNATFARDGKRLYFESKDGDKDRIAVVPVAGGTPAWALPAGTLAPAQSPTADLLAYLADAPAGRIVMVLDERTAKSRAVAPTLAPYPYRDLRFSPDGTRLLAARRDGQLVELDLATGKSLRVFDVGSDTLQGLTYAGDEILVGRSTSAGDLWEAALQ